MSSFVQRLIADDFVWSAVTDALPARRKRVNGGVAIDCPMCTDKRFRCGLTYRNSEVIIHCFNCAWSTRHHKGDLLSKRLRAFLAALGVDESEIHRLNHKAAQYRSIFEASPEAMALLPQTVAPRFEPTRLPKGARPLAEWAARPDASQDFLDTLDYLAARGDELFDAITYYWTPDPSRGLHRRLIIPFTFEGQIVGWTARSIDAETQPRYLTESQPNFLFNARALTDPRRKYVILVEGVFDALAIDAVGTMGAHLNAQQIAWIKSQGKTVILLPDRDKDGARMIDVAVENKWAVAAPVLRDGINREAWWEADVKDAAEATRRYGRLWTLLSVIQTATTNSTEARLLQKLLF